MRAAGCDPAGWSTRRSNDQCSMARHPRSALDNPDYQPRLGLSLEIRRSRKQLRAHRLAGLGPVSRISPGHQSRPIRSAAQAPLPDITSGSQRPGGATVLGGWPPRRPCGKTVPHRRFTRRTVPAATPPEPSVAAGPDEPAPARVLPSSLRRASRGRRSARARARVRSTAQALGPRLPTVVEIPERVRRGRSVAPGDQRRDGRQAIGEQLEEHPAFTKSGASWTPSDGSQARPSTAARPPRVG